MPPKEAPEQHSENELKRIRTFQGDVEELLRHNKVSKASIAIAENEKRVKQETLDSQDASVTTPDASKVFTVSSSLALAPRWNIRLIVLVAAGIVVVSGIGIGAFLFFGDNEKPAVAEQQTQIPKSVAITLAGGESRAGVLKAIADNIATLSVPQNQLRIIPMTLGILNITTEGLFSMLETSAPTPLTRALGTTPTLGVHGFRGGQPFMLFSVSSYDHSFAGMLAWEKNLLRDIGPLFGVLPREILGKASSTTSEALGNRIVIKDAIVRNKDARAAFDPQGKIVFLYSFIDKQTLVFTTNEDTLKLLINKAWGGRLR